MPSNRFKNLRKLKRLLRDAARRVVDVALYCALRVAIERPDRNAADAFLLGEGGDLLSGGLIENFAREVVQPDHRREADHLPKLGVGLRRAVQSLELTDETHGSLDGIVPHVPLRVR